MMRRDLFTAALGIVLFAYAATAQPSLSSILAMGPRRLHSYIVAW